MAEDDDLQQVRILCPSNGGSELLQQLGEIAGDAIRGGLRSEVRAGHLVIEFATSDLDAVRQAMRRSAPNGTALQVNVPEPHGLWIASAAWETRQSPATAEDHPQSR